MNKVQIVFKSHLPYWEAYFNYSIGLKLHFSSNPGEYQKVTYILMQQHKDGYLNLYFSQVNSLKQKEIFLILFQLAHIPGKLEVKILCVPNLKDL